MKVMATLPASDLDRAKAWYSEVLGLEPVDVDPGGDLIYEAGGVRFFLYSSQFAGDNQATAAGIEVEDFDAAVTGFKARGGVLEDYDFGEDLRTVDGIITLPDGSKATWMKDSEGNILRISESP